MIKIIKIKTNYFLLLLIFIFANLSITYSEGMIYFSKSCIYLKHYDLNEGEDVKTLIENPQSLKDALIYPKVNTSHFSKKNQKLLQLNKNLIKELDVLEVKEDKEKGSCTVTNIGDKSVKLICFFFKKYKKR